MKVLLLQLPVPNNKLSNLPLALGYLKASADAANLPGVQVDIMERIAQDRGGDAFLLDAILQHDPDIVGFSLYSWNSARALQLARALKTQAPRIITLAGGPEVNRDGDFVLAASTALDFLILGEGERTFVELLKSLNGRPMSNVRRPKFDRQFPFTPSIASLPGLAYPAPGGLDEWVFNPPRSAIEDVNLLPSVYLSGALDGFLERFMMIELSRWCPSKCTFCYYGRQDLPLGGKRYFEVERVRQELLFGLAHGVEQVHFVEANFNTLPHLPQLYQIIQDTGANRQMRFYAEMRAEAINQAEADQLAAGNFGVVECGLQSAVPEVLARVRRKNHLPRLVRGVQLLRERGIEVFLDAILGLPGDSPETFRQTLAFIHENGLAPYDLFHLQILPGTQLKAEAPVGLEWQAAPPYFALQTDTLSFEQLCELRRETLAAKGEDPAQVQGLPLPGPFALVQPPPVGLTSNAQGLEAQVGPIERLILEQADLNDTATLRQVARRLASEVTLWLRLAETDLAAAAKALQELSEPNPSGTWHILVERARPLNAAERAHLAGAVRHAAGYLDGLAVFALNEREVTNFKEWPSVSLYELVPWQPALASQAGPKTIWQIALPEAETVGQWRERLEAVSSAPGCGLHLRFPPGVALQKVQTVLQNSDLADKMLFLAEWELAAGHFAAQSDEPVVFNFPLTLHLARPWPSPSLTELDRAALRWAVTARLGR